MPSTPVRRRLGLTTGVAVLAASVLAGTGATADAAPSTAGTTKANSKTRAVDAMLHAGRAARSGGTKALAPSTSTRKLAKADRSPDKGLRSVQELAPLTPNAAPTCEDLAFDWTPTNDRVWVHWQSIGVDNYTILRQRDGGSWKQLGVVQAGGTSFLDRTVNPRGLFTYRLDADGISCNLPAQVSMSTDDGWGEADALWGAAPAAEGTGPLMMQDTHSLALATKLTGMDPAFSPDGGRVATANSTDGTTWSMVISSVRAGGRDVVLRTLPMPAGTVGAEPSWSPNGLLLAYTRYTIDPATGNATGSVLRVIDTRTGSDKVVSGSDGLVMADWRSASTLITAGGLEGEGLFTIGSTGGTKAAVAGTTAASYPEVAPNGKTYFTSGDGTTHKLNVISTTGAVTPLQTSTTHSFESPRVSPDGTLYFVDVDNTDPQAPLFTVMTSPHGTDEPVPTTIGGPVGTETGFYGYDVRQPKSKGTSDFVGDAGPDILARDARGSFFAYPSTPTKLAGARTQIGKGWDIYNAFLAAGDLNNDNRADILARDKDGKLWRYDGLGGGKVAGRVQIGAGWNGYLPLAPGDFNGDGNADLIARSTTGELWLYPGTGLGTLGTRSRLGTGWQGMNSIVGVGDFDLDNDADIVAREASTSKLWLYPGNGAGGFGARRLVGNGWNTFKGIAGPELLGTNPWVYAKTGTGDLIAYRVLGDGRFSGDEVYQVGTGWGPYAFTS